MKIRSNEQSWVLVGSKVGGVWVGRRKWESEGEPASVDFPWKRVLQRHNRKDDIIGFCHTHPNMSATPSSIDIVTMQAWVMTLGKPLICVIAGNDGLRGYLFPDDDSIGIELFRVYDLGFGITIGLEHGRPTVSRNRIPWRRFDEAVVEA